MKNVLRHKTTREFDINNVEDVQLYARFLKTGRWGQAGCPFEPVWPALTVLDTINRAIIDRYIEERISEEM